MNEESYNLCPYVDDKGVWKIAYFHQWNYNVMLYSHEKLGGDMIHQSMQNSYAAGLGHTCKLY